MIAGGHGEVGQQEEIFGQDLSQETLCRVSSEFNCRCTFSHCVPRTLTAVKPQRDN